MKKEFKHFLSGITVAGLVSVAGLACAAEETAPTTEKTAGVETTTDATKTPTEAETTGTPTDAKDAKAAGSCGEGSCGEGSCGAAPVTEKAKSR